MIGGWPADMHVQFSRPKTNKILYLTDHQDLWIQPHYSIFRSGSRNMPQFGFGSELFHIIIFEKDKKNLIKIFFKFFSTYEEKILIKTIPGTKLMQREERSK